MKARDLGMALDELIAAGWGDVDVVVHIGDVLLLVKEARPMVLDPMTGATATECVVSLEVRL